MIRRYAEGTQVSVEKTRAEIETFVRKRGASTFGSISQAGGASIFFELRKRQIRLSVPTPKIADGAKREAEERRLWRCLLLNVKAKFEAVDNGIASFDAEFLADIVVPGSHETVGERAVGALRAAYEEGANMPPLLNA